MYSIPDGPSKSGLKDDAGERQVGQSGGIPRRQSAHVHVAVAGDVGVSEAVRVAAQGGAKVGRRSLT